MKKVIVFIFILSLGLSMLGCSTVDTDQHHHTSTTSKEEAILEISQIYVETELNLTNTACMIGNQLPAYCLSAGELVSFSYEMYPVFAEDKIVAFTTCFLSDTGEYLTGCGADYAEAFWKEYSKQPNVPVAIVCAQDGAYLVRDGETPVLLHNIPLADYDSIQELEKCRSTLAYSVP